MESLEELYTSGMAAYQAGDRAKALEFYRKVMSEDTNKTQYYHSARFNIACNLVDMGNPEGMKIMKEAAMDDHPTALYYMGVQFERRNDCRSITCYVRATLLGSKEAVDALVDLGIVSILDGRTLESCTVFW